MQEDWGDFLRTPTLKRGDIPGSQPAQTAADTQLEHTTTDVANEPGGRHDNGTITVTTACA